MFEAIKEFLTMYFDIETVKTILYYTEILFVFYLMGYSTFLFASVVAGGNELFENIKRKKLHNIIKHDYYVPVSIIVPAYNEEITIIETIRSLEKLNYKIFEIILYTIFFSALINRKISQVLVSNKLPHKHILFCMVFYYF